MKKNYDFAGWVTKNDTLCSDGVIIRHDAFAHQDGIKVPLVWQHSYSDPGNILGNIQLENHKNGVYGYGYFNNTPQARNAKDLLNHGDISSMSIAARKVKKSGQNVVHGQIFEVSLVLTPANPGALIEEVVTHGDDDSTAIIYTGNLIHSAESLTGGEEAMENTKVKDFLKSLTEEEAEELLDIIDMEDEEFSHSDTKTIGEVMDTMSKEQRQAVEALLGYVLAGMEDNEDITQTGEGDYTLKHNVFANRPQDEDYTLVHSEILESAKDYGTLKAAMEDYMLEHSITNIDLLFPEAKYNTNEPQIYRDTNTGATQILSGVTKTPFSRVKNLVANFTEDEARARGYIKGNEKLEQVFKLLSRETNPQTVYKKQKLDRDDMIDITDFNVVAFLNKEMRFMLEEEIARAVLVGDGRQASDPSKIKEDKIRPIVTDDDFYTIKKETAGAATFVETVIKSMAEYKGSGAPTLYISPALLADIRLLKGTDGRFLFGDIPSVDAIGARIGVAKIVPTTLLDNEKVAAKAVIVNLKDYTIGATKGGEITTFDDFDIDYNQHKYLIETRLSGALTVPKSAIAISIKAAAEGLSAGASGK